MTLPLVLLNRRRIGGFNPRAILAGSTAFLWFDPSDLTTMFQDSAGTTPVTAPAQPVGLVLDKSQGLVLGPELVTNGDFSNGTTGWTAANAALSVVGGALRMSVNNTGSYLTEITALVPTVAGRSYELSGLVSRVSGGVSVGLIAASAAYATLAQTQQISGSALTPVRAIFTAVGSTTRIAVIRGTTVSSGEIYEADNISVRELPGFHATQSTAANRPTYGVVPSRGRVNLLTMTERFDNAAWANSSPDVPTVAANTTETVAPDGSNTSDKITAATGGTSSHLRQFVSGSFSGVYTISVFVKAGNSTQSRLRLFDNGFGTVANALINWSGGSISSLTSVTGTASYQTVGDGWFRVSITTASLGSNASLLPAFYPDSSAGTGHVYLWGAQLETGSTATPYQRVVSQFDVTDPAGFPSYPLHYLFFGGDLDPRWLQTSTITPSADKVQVFAGVRKLSDAVANGIVCEFSTLSASNAGSFALLAPSGSANTYAFFSRGSINGSGGSSAASYASPISNVITGLGDIPADITRFRVNAAQVVESTLDQGTGNFLAYPLYIGRRGGTSLAFNGQLYGLIVRFSTANLDASLINQTERWLAQKTGVTI